ncbi:MAG: helicase C-terminal domain-containing protein [Verrucomicrobiota bacterium]
MREFFSASGPMSAGRDFEFRPQQQEMAVEVSRALEEERPVILEAGTGVGKSLAYLVPSIHYALEKRKKAVISTHTINLQEQLIEKDIPLAQRIIERGFRAVLLKGRQNYVCPTRLARAIRSGPELFTSSDRVELDRIAEWADETSDGSTSDLPFTPEHRVWAQVCSEPALCTPRTCGPNSGCFYQAARREVAEADVVVLNHTLLFMMLSAQLEEGDGDGFIFPDDFLVIDEAHAMESIAAQQFGLRVSHANLRFHLHRFWNPRTKKGQFHLVKHMGGLKSTQAALDAADEFFDAVEEAVKFPPYSNSFRVRRPELIENNLAAPLLAVEESALDVVEQTDSELSQAEIRDLATRVRELRRGVADFLDQALEGQAYWIEKGGEGRSVSLNSAKISVAEDLRRILFESGKPCVLTSATLGTGGDELGYFRCRVGAEQVEGRSIGSPFDFTEQMKIFAVKSMPEPKSDAFAGALQKWIEEFVRRSHGRAFVLFTSHRLMRDTADQMAGFFEDEGFKLLVQGRGMPRGKLIEQFREDVSSVLFGTDSFWTGVDVPGEALSNVIVTRLPFAVPDHPLVASRIERIEREGGNAFMEYSVPEAILKLRQGVGRLIRSARDEGIVVLLDNRVLTKQYGRAFLNALPDAPVEVVS